MADTERAGARWPERPPPCLLLTQELSRSNRAPRASGARPHAPAPCAARQRAPTPRLRSALRALAAAGRKGAEPGGAGCESARRRWRRRAAGRKSRKHDVREGTERSCFALRSAEKGRARPVKVQDSARCWATRNHFRVVLSNPGGAWAIMHSGKCSPSPTGVETLNSVFHRPTCL